MPGSRGTEIQYRLLRVAAALKYDGIAAANCRSGAHERGKFSAIPSPATSARKLGARLSKAIGLIDVIWFEKGKNRIVCVFEIEKGDSPSSGMRRLTELAKLFSHIEILITIVAPDQMEEEIKSWLKRPSLTAGRAGLSYLLFSDISSRSDSLCKLGSDYAILEKLVERCV